MKENELRSRAVEIVSIMAPYLDLNKVTADPQVQPHEFFQQLRRNCIRIETAIQTVRRQLAVLSDGALDVSGGRRSE